MSEVGTIFKDASYDGNEVYLKAESLSVGYDGKALIHDIDIRVRRGEILTLIGPNGAGKSTIIKTLTKNLKGIAGTVYIGDNVLDDTSARDLSLEMAVVLTERLRTELMTCQEVVETGRYPYTGRLGILSEEDKVKVRDALELVDMWEMRNRDFMHISDGQRQRLLLARAICQEPNIIVLDEPTSFLDIRYQIELLSVLRRMVKEKNIAVVMSLHELDMAQKISDKIMCVHGSTIYKYGTPEEIFTSDLVADLYSLENGKYDPLFGSVEMAKPKGKPHTFVVAGGSTGAETFRSLQKENIPFIAGILHENDVDYALAKDLASGVVSERPFEKISDETYSKALEELRKCDRVICCVSQFGTGNARNLDLIHDAESMGLEIIRADARHKGMR
ncbi:MAG: ABC transporter ATP-binding protein [Coriobacteriales bacterium]|jgi:iron complex transport system ATP-binding protein